MHTNLRYPPLFNDPFFAGFCPPLSALRTTSEKAKLWRVSLEDCQSLGI